MNPPKFDRLLDVLLPLPPKDGNNVPDVFAVLDGAREKRVYRAVYASRLDYECLFTGNIPYDLAESAPYLVRLTRTADFTRWVLEECWGNAVGIFAWSRADLESMRRHFRRLLQVRDEKGRNLYFRYYDPRVLRAYLPTCTALEMNEVFGPVERLLVEGATDEVLSCNARLREGCDCLQWEHQRLEACVG